MLKHYGLAMQRDKNMYPICIYRIQVPWDKQNNYFFHPDTVGF